MTINYIKLRILHELNLPILNVGVYRWAAKEADKQGNFTLPMFEYEYSKFKY